MRGGWVYLLANRYRGTIYTGVTADLARRTWQHREARGGSTFTKRYGVVRLVHAEEYPTIDEAIAREKAIKKWRRAWKMELIEKANPDWNDLYDYLIGL
jgi:putative endonuclease